MFQIGKRLRKLHFQDAPDSNPDTIHESITCDTVVLDRNCFGNRGAAREDAEPHDECKDDFLAERSVNINNKRDGLCILTVSEHPPNDSSKMEL